MKLLTEYSKNGYHFTLVKRVEDAAIFRGRKPTSPSNNWEVIRIQKSLGGLKTFHTTESKPVEVMFEPKEYPPGDNQWGDKGWTCLTLEAAEEKLSQLAQTKQP